MTRTIERRPLRDAVYRDLRERIVEGGLPPGTRLRDTALAQELGVSRTPVREALVRLTHDGFVEADTGRGFTVRALQVADIESAYPILWTLESLALSLCPPFTETQLATLARINRRLERADQTPAERLAIDTEWHAALLAQCPNSRLLEMIASLKEFLAVYEFAYARRQTVATSLTEHAAILDALRNNDVARAQRALEQNWRGTLEQLKPWLASLP
jgi:DNA-binding GntR family transcriptional regulator